MLLLVEKLYDVQPTSFTPQSHYNLEVLLSVHYSLKPPTPYPPGLAMPSW